MNAQPNMISSNNKTSEKESNELDLLLLLGILLDRKWFILFFTLLFTSVGVTYAIFSTPIYQATSMLQLEEKGRTLPGFDEMSGMLEASAGSVTEIALLKSRRVLGETVDVLQLNTEALPVKFPFIGDRYYRNFKPSFEGEVAAPKFGLDSYAWGGEQINVHRLDVPSAYVGATFTLIARADNQFVLLLPDGSEVLAGKVGEEVEGNGFKIAIEKLYARSGTEFTIRRLDRLGAILALQRAIVAAERGTDSGILNLSLEHADPEHAKRVLNKVADIYVKRNVERSSAEAQKSLEFLRVQLPVVKKELEQAESRFNSYKVEQQSVDISLETQAVLAQIVKLDTKLQELDLERLELSRKFKEEHPSYQGVLQQIDVVKQQRNVLSLQVQSLPETQQELLRLTRDVEVNNEIYTLLLAKTQELDIVRAGTVGNVRVIDSAEVNISAPVKPQKAFIVLLTTLLGLIISSVIVLVRRALNKGIEDAAQIEALGLPVYASVPFSEYQEKLTGFSKARKGKVNKPKSLLAVDNPADLSIEALRSLRTSLHFAMMEAKNNVIAISGPSPGVGKSFISVNLAIVLAQSDKKIIIIDADMRKGYLHTQFSMKWGLGLSDLLSGKNTLEEVVKPTEVAGLDVITRGQVPPNPSELLMHENFNKMIEKLSAEYDFVLVDTPPILAVTDPAIVSAHAGTTLLVTRFGQNHVKELEITKNRFDQNGINVKGVVFNGVLRKSSNAYGYYGYYNYEYKSDK
ncbi:polysaccharide biosynthesis tyrosine autokinase [Pseudoalteromonas luteoviolacea]|uniref:polysaccharide biosynthesis tyrosine autokinase n=1 Tax=Pseudoalteromonas luteoviolacea TaxID=43657 RepID=UPI001EED4E6B|nr:polysaccharide biosynthesis tyrosine autokinase [Pseudoalteromonas luteoviolacea]MCF6439056.1 polysaccharide biosynthesis tyrosine autokinase [Pseudoalteromonas luteoviolacea]